MNITIHNRELYQKTGAYFGKHTSTAGLRRYVFIFIALMAGTILHAAAQTTDTYWSQDGTTIYYNVDGGAVVIGDLYPTNDAKFTVKGSIYSDSIVTPELIFDTEFKLKGGTDSDPILYAKESDENTMQLAINSGEFATGAGLTVKGPAYFAKEGSTLITIKDEYLDKFNVWVDGGLMASDIYIAATSNWADYVFENDYPLMSLDSLGAFIKANQHLPGVPARQDVEEQGYYSSHTMSMTLLQKVEELTLYTLQQDAQIQQALKELEACKEQLNNLEQRPSQ